MRLKIADQDDGSPVIIDGSANTDGWYGNDIGTVVEGVELALRKRGLKV